MKNILITGTNSYIGNSLEQWLEKYPEKYNVDKISLRNEEWKTRDFSIYDSIVHTVGIAHIKENQKNKDLYYKINYNLACDVAEKAKKENVSQFIFLSSMSIYGINEGVITNKTIPKPNNSYGISKFKAEKKILSLQAENFLVAIIRPPMVYGENCPGNYRKLSKIARKLPFFFFVDNARSMIYIDHLSEFLKILIDKKASGIFLPQNNEYVNTSQMIYLIRKEYGKQIKLLSVGGRIISKINLPTLRKMFGTLVYEDEDKITYSQFSFEETIKKSESRN